MEGRKREWRLKFDELNRSFDGTQNARKRVITFVNFELVFDSMFTAKVQVHCPESACVEKRFGVFGGRFGVSQLSTWAKESAAGCQKY